jgi:hypothetical protein
MKKNYGLFCGLSRLGVGAVLPALLVFAAACILSVSSAQADVTGWDFTGMSYSGQGAYSATSGSDFTSASLAVSGNSTHFVNESGNLQTSYLDNRNNTLTFTLTSSSTITLTSLTYSYNYDDTGTPGTTTIVWTLGTFTSSGSENVINDGNSSGSIDLSAAGANATGTTFTLTGTQTGVPGVSGNIDFSNFSITAVPEPVNFALAGFGLLFVGGSAGRFYLARRRASNVI